MVPYTTDPNAIPFPKVYHVPDATVRYACPDDHWRAHHAEWARRYRQGDKTAPEPCPQGHLMFERPVDYASVPYGCTDPTVIRAAWECHVRDMLYGWDRELQKTEEGRATFERIVEATIGALMDGQELGAAPWRACILAGI